MQISLHASMRVDARRRARSERALKPRLHQIHVAGYKYPGRATRYKWIQLVSGLHYHYITLHLSKQETLYLLCILSCNPKGRI